MAKRKQFTFYWSFYDALVDLPIEQAQKGAWVIITYALLGKLPDMDLEPPVKVAFKLVKPTLDAAKKKANGAISSQEIQKKRRKEIALEHQRKNDTEKQDIDRIAAGCSQDVGKKKEVENENEVEVENEVEIKKEKESFYTDSVCVKADTRADGFERFWDMYPIKLAKQQAWEVWIEDPPETDRVMTALSCWMRSKQWLREDGRFIPKAATFLREKYYEQIPQGSVPMGASGYLGKAELEAIERLMNGNV